MNDDPSWMDFTTLPQENRLLLRYFAAQEETEETLDFLETKANYDDLFRKASLLLVEVTKYASEFQDGCLVACLHSLTHSEKTLQPLQTAIKETQTAMTGNFGVNCFVPLEEICTTLIHSTLKRFQVDFLDRLKSGSYLKHIGDPFFCHYATMKNTTKALQFCLAVNSYESKRCLDEAEAKSIWQKFTKPPGLHATIEQKQKMKETGSEFSDVPLFELRREQEPKLNILFHEIQHQWKNVPTNDPEFILNYKSLILTILYSPYDGLYQSIFAMKAFRGTTLETASKLRTRYESTSGQSEFKKDDFVVSQVKYWSEFLPTFHRFSAWVSTLEDNTRHSILEDMEKKNIENTKRQKLSNENIRRNSGENPKKKMPKSPGKFRSLWNAIVPNEAPVAEPDPAFGISKLDFTENGSQTPSFHVLFAISESPRLHDSPDRETARSRPSHTITDRVTRSPSRSPKTNPRRRALSSEARDSLLQSLSCDKTGSLDSITRSLSTDWEQSRVNNNTSERVTKTPSGELTDDLQKSTKKTQSTGDLFRRKSSFPRSPSGTLHSPPSSGSEKRPLATKKSVEKGLKVREKFDLPMATSQEESIQNLVSALLKQTINPMQVTHVIHAIPAFFPPIDVFKIFLKLKEENTESPMEFLVKISNLVKSMISVLYAEFFSSEEVHNTVLQYIDALYDKSDKMGEFLRIKLMTEKTKHKLKAMPSPMSNHIADPNFSLLRLPSVLLAQQLSLIDTQHLTSIPIVEFYNTNWMNEKQAPHLTSLATFSNNLVYRFLHEIYEAGTSKDSATLITNLTNLGMELLNFRNFNSLLIVHLSLHSPHIIKLGKTFQLLGKRVAGSIKVISKIFSPTNSFAAYRNEVSSTEELYIPAREILLQDLLYITESTKSFEGPCINALKVLNTGKIISTFRQLPSSSFEVVPQIMDHLHSLYHQPPVNPESILKMRHEDLQSESPETRNSFYKNEIL